MKVWPKTHCPTCLARPGEMCRSKSGKRCHEPHTTRPLDFKTTKPFAMSAGGFDLDNV